MEVEKQNKARNNRLIGLVFYFYSCFKLNIFWEQLPDRTAGSVIVLARKKICLPRAIGQVIYRSLRDERWMSLLKSLVWHVSGLKFLFSNKFQVQLIWKAFEIKRIITDLRIEQCQKIFISLWKIGQQKKNVCRDLFRNNHQCMKRGTRKPRN